MQDSEQAQAHTQIHRKNTRKVLEVMVMFTTLIVMITWVHMYVQTHQDVFIKCAQIFVYKLYLKSFLKSWENYFFFSKKDDLHVVTCPLEYF